MHRFGDDTRLRPDALIAFVIGILIAYVLQGRLGFGGGAIFTTLIVVAVGGFWYHWRKIL